MKQRGYSLTFSRRNRHVQEILEEKKKENEIITDYICKTIEFYEKYKDYDFLQRTNQQVTSTNTVNKNELKEFINESVKDILLNSLTGNFFSNDSKTADTVPEKKIHPLEEVDESLLNLQEDE